MKTLFLLRHAMSQRATGWDNDSERALSDRGRKDASEIGALMRDQRRIPSLTIYSSARRAAETWRLIAPELRVDVPTVANESLYLASPQHLLTTITSAPEQYASILIVGHNPGLHDLALVLVRSGAREDVELLRGGYPAGALTEIQFDVDRWSELRPETGRLEWIAFPGARRGKS